MKCAKCAAQKDATTVETAASVTTTTTKKLSQKGIMMRVRTMKIDTMSKSRYKELAHNAFLLIACSVMVYVVVVEGVKLLSNGNLY